MSRRHPTYEELDHKRQNIATEKAKKSKSHPEGRDVVPFENILRARKHRHDRNVCADPKCALRNTSPESLLEKLLAPALDLSKPPDAGKEVTG